MEARALLCLAAFAGWPAIPKDLAKDSQVPEAVRPWLPPGAKIDRVTAAGGAVQLRGRARLDWDAAWDRLAQRCGYDGPFAHDLRCNCTGSTDGGESTTLITTGGRERAGLRTATFSVHQPTSTMTLTMSRLDSESETHLEITCHEVSPQAAKPIKAPEKPAANDSTKRPFDRGVARPKSPADGPDAAGGQAGPPRPNQPDTREAPRMFSGSIVYVEGSQIGRGNNLCSLLLAEPEVRVFGDMAFISGRNIGADSKATSKRVWVPLKAVTRIEEFDSIEALTSVIPVKLGAVK